MINKKKVKKAQSTSLKEENYNLKYELKELKRAKKEKTHSILLVIYIILAITFFVKTESIYVFFGALGFGVIFHAFLDHVVEIHKEE